LTRSDEARGEAGDDLVRHDDAIDDSPWRPLAFSAGNPRAEIIHGELHLFRDTLTASASSSGPTGNHGNVTDALPKDRHPTVCVLAVPSSLSVSDFCRFVAALVPKIVEMRMVVSEGELLETEKKRASTRAKRGDFAARDERASDVSENVLDSECEPPVSIRPGPGPSSSSSSYTVILRFVDQESADAFVRNYHDRKFNAFCEETCRVLFVRSGEVTSRRGGAETEPGDSDGKPAPQTSSSRIDPPENTVELPSCPVCLERLDNEASGIVTTVCSHAFHAACISNWEDASCPVCRYTQSPGDATRCEFPNCRETNETASLWACLICGRVGCGRYEGKHSLDHWRESGHCYALELRTQRVWDYVRDGFVHRLIQSEAGLVELSPGNGARSAAKRPGAGPRRFREDQRTSGESGRSLAGSSGGDHCGVSDAPCDSSPFEKPARGVPRASASGRGARFGGGGGLDASREDRGLDEYDRDYPLDPELEEALVSSKLDAIHAEYSQLLTSQLDSQRRYFEGLVAVAAAEKEGALSAAAAAERQAEVIARAVRDAREARRILKECRGERDAQVRRIEELQKERDFLRSVNEALTLNQREVERVAARAAEGLSRSSREKDERIRDLEEHVRDLMVFLDARDKASNASGSGGTESGDSILGGDVVGVADPSAGAGVDNAPSRSSVHARLQKKLAARQEKKRGG
jgi:BRCA1-associated protein